MPTLATFNANNFFLRYRFAGTYPGDQRKKSAIEAGEVAMLGCVPEKKFTDFNDTEESPWLSPLLSSKLLVDVLARTRPVDDRWC